MRLGSMLGILFCGMQTLWAAVQPEVFVQQKLRQIHSMTANFNQIVKAGSREIANSSGTMALLRPGRFRWETKEPMAQIIVADSQKVWIYDVELEQVTIKNQEKEAAGTPGLFLSGADTVARDFIVKLEDKNNQQLFDLQAKSPKENYQRVKLLFTNKGLTQIDFYDQLGQHTVVKLNKIKQNPNLNKAIFQFTPPKGVDVIQQ